MLSINLIDRSHDFAKIVTMSWSPVDMKIPIACVVRRKSYPTPPPTMDSTIRMLTPIFAYFCLAAFKLYGI
jgi:hypothetical protein